MLRRAENHVARYRRCHRTALTRAILGLQQAVSMDVLFYRRDPDRVRAGTTRPRAGTPVRQSGMHTSVMYGSGCGMDLLHSSVAGKGR